MLGSDPFKTTSAWSAGNVIVKVREHESNTVPLTEWRSIKTKYNVDLGGVFGAGFNQKVDCDLHLRADVHPYREQPGTEPIQPTDVYYRVASDSTCTVAMNGANEDFNLFKPGPGNMTWGNDHTDPATLMDWFSMWGHIDTKAMVINGIFSMGVKGFLEIKQQGKTVDYPLVLNMEVLGYDGMTIPPPGIYLLMDGAYNLAADEKLGSTSEILFNLSWQDAVASDIPEPDTTMAVIAY